MTTRYAIWAGTYGYAETPVSQWLRAFEPEANEGRGMIYFTPNPDAALTFATSTEAIAFANTQPVTMPLREDCEPNIPLRGFDLQIVPVEVRASARASQSATTEGQ